MRSPGGGGDDARWSTDATALMDALPLPIGLLDAGLRVVRANSALLPMLGGEPARVQGRYLYDLGKMWGSPSVRHVLEELLAKDDGGSVDVRVDGLVQGKARYRLHAHRVPSKGPKRLVIWLSGERG